MPAQDAPICIGDPTSLYRLQYGILEGVALALKQGGSVNDGPPAKRYVSVGDPVFECPQLTVHATNIRMAPGRTDGNGYRMCTSEYHVDITVTLLRCYPSDPGLKTEVLNEYARILNLDAALMYFGFECLLMQGGNIIDGLLDLNECRLFGPGIMNPITPQAGVGGWTWMWTFVLPPC